MTATCQALVRSAPYQRGKGQFCDSPDVIVDIKYIDVHEHMGNMGFCEPCLVRLREICRVPGARLVCIPCQDLGHDCDFRVEVHFRDGTPTEILQDPAKKEHDSPHKIAEDYALSGPLGPQTWKALGGGTYPPVPSISPADYKAWEEIAGRALRDVQERYNHATGTRAEVRQEEGTQ